jgi:hypothetical protein
VLGPVFGKGSGDGPAPLRLTRDHQVKGIRGPGKAVQVGLDLPHGPANSQHGFKDSVPPGGALVRDQELGPGGIGEPAVRERRIEENENHGSWRGHGSSLVRRRTDKLDRVPWLETVRREPILRG